MHQKRAELIATIQKAMALARETVSDTTEYLLETALAEEIAGAMLKRPVPTKKI